MIKIMESKNNVKLWLNFLLSLRELRPINLLMCCLKSDATPGSSEVNGPIMPLIFDVS